MDIISFIHPLLHFLLASQASTAIITSKSWNYFFLYVFNITNPNLLSFPTISHRICFPCLNESMLRKICGLMHCLGSRHNHDHVKNNFRIIYRSPVNDDALCFEQKTLYQGGAIWWIRIRNSALLLFFSSLGDIVCLLAWPSINQSINESLLFGVGLRVGDKIWKSLAIFSFFICQIFWFILFFEFYL